MKRKRLLAAGLSLALTLSLSAAPAWAAVSFPDVETHWAKEYIVRMTEEGLFTGYEDGTFKPERALTAAEALTLCARIATLSYGLDDDTIQTMTDAWADELEELLGPSYSWFYDEAAVALESGILSWDDLTQRAQAGAMGSPLQKELFSVYLVRAMGLNTLAQSLSIYTLDFADADSVTENYAPYVYLLSSYGVLTGDENKNFNPNMAVNRAISATMLCRILDYMDTAGLEPELAEYTEYDWKSGLIETVTTGEKSEVKLELSNEISGSWSVTIPGGADIYKNDRTAELKDLKSGLYARVCYDEDGDIFAVRLYDAARFATVTGKVEEAGTGSITIQSGTKEYTIPIDRFTQVSMGGRYGDRELIAAGSGYAQATVQYAKGGSAVSIQLKGGDRTEEGLISGVTALSDGGYTLQLTGMNGVERQYTVEEDADITINGLGGALKSSHIGSFARISVSNDDLTSVSAVTVDSLTEYVCGSVKYINSSGISIADLETGKTAVYSVADDAQIYYEEKEVQLGDLDNSDYVTVKLSDDEEAVMISAWPGSVETSGELTGIAYGTTTVLTVEQADGSEVQFSLDMSNLPDIERNGAESTIAKLTTGDQVVVTTRYQQVTHIEATTQSANEQCTIVTVTHSANASELTVEMEDGTTKTYNLNESVSVTRDGKVIARTTLQPGYQLALTVSGDEILSVEVEGETESASKLTGTALYVDTTAREILFEMDEGGVVTVKASTSTQYVDAGGGSLSLKTVGVGDSLIVYGGYHGGDFEATLIIRE